MAWPREWLDLTNELIDLQIWLFDALLTKYGRVMDGWPTRDAAAAEEDG